MIKKKEETAFDALKRIDELEKENKNLKDRVKRLRFDLLKREEKLWVKNVFDMLHPNAVELPFDDEWRDFICQYMDFKDSQPLGADDLFPF